MPLPNPKDFETWAADARARLLRSAVSILKDRSEAENVVQETLLSVWEAHRQGHAIDLDPYAKRAVWLNSLRRRSRWHDWEPLDPELTAPAEIEDLTPWELERAIRSLSPVQQVAIRLRFYGGHSFHEMGETLSVSMNTAASRCRYALIALRAALRIPPQQTGEEE